MFQKTKSVPKVEVRPDTSELENELLMQVADDPHEFQLFLQLHRPGRPFSESFPPIPACASVAEIARNHQRPPVDLARRRIKKNSFSTSDLTESVRKFRDAESVGKLRRDMGEIERKIRCINERNNAEEWSATARDEEVRYQNFSRQFQRLRGRRRGLVSLWRLFLVRLRSCFCCSR